MPHTGLKAVMRIEMKQKRDVIPAAERAKKSETIREYLFSLPEFKKAKLILFYASKASEVPTDDIIKEVLKEKKVLLPKVSEGQIIPTLILDMDNLIPGYGGIREPIDPLPTKLSTIDLVVVPGLAFSKDGTRLGMGNGMYDMFLKKVPKATRVGLCFDTQIVDKIPSDELDVPMQVLISESGIKRIDN